MFLLTLRCNRCGVRWKVKSKTPSGPKRPRCPSLDCGKVVKDIGFDPSEQKAPAIGGSILARAIDTTAEIVMQDHGLTDLQDNVREGDIVAPKLPPPQQKQADSFFSPASNPRLSRRRRNFIDALGKRAIAGSFRQTALDVKGVLGGRRGEAALTPVRIEQLRR